MASKRNAAAALGERLLAVLEAQRTLGKEAYPLTLQRLADLADPSAPVEQVKEAVGKKPFTERAVLASSKTKDPASLVALADDIEQLAGDPRLLESALASLCTPENPLWPLSEIKKRIENSRLRKPFGEAAARRVREYSLPPAVGVRFSKKTPLLYLQRVPPPPPPPPPDQALAEKLLQVLDAQRRLGGNSYPLPLKRLVELTASQAKPTLVAKALGQPAAQEKLLLLDAKNPQLPVAFVEDGAQLFSSGALLEQLMRKQLKPTNNAVAVDKLLPSKSAHLTALRDAVNRRIDAGQLPPTVGWLWVGKKKLLFFLEDIRRGRQPDGKVAAAAVQPAPPGEVPADFARAFDEAFQRIDRAKGGHNFVSLVELRRALPMAPDAFNAELRELRIAGRYTLSGAEGRHGLTPEERQAGVVEDGALLLYVSRKNP